MENENQPLVSIGVPVYNGEKTIARALDALTGQDYTNLEIIISDNASTDATREICEEYVQKDHRVTYSRAEKNMGSIWNFNKVVELSSGKYFMWAADDDERELSFVSACVEKIEQCPEAAVCQAYTGVFVEGIEEKMCVVHTNSFDQISDLVERYKETLIQSPAMSIYGLYRLSVMHKTHLLEKFIASDMAFVQEISIYGDIVQVPRILFNYYGREKWNTIHDDYFVFFGKKKKPWWYLPFIVMFYHHCRRVALSTIPLKAKLRLWSVLFAHETGQVALKVLIKLGRWFCPERYKVKIGSAIYWRWMHSVNVDICNEELYLERVIKPRLGWWG